MTTELKPVAYQLTAPSLGNVNGIVTIEEFSHYLFSDYAIPLYAIPEGHAAVEKDLLADGGVAQKAFWHAFEQAKCNDNMNIRNSWEEYKTMLNKTGDK